MDPENNFQTSTVKRDSNSTGIIELLRLFYFRKKLILLITGVITVAAIIVSLILPETFKAAAILLPETDKSRLGGLGGLSDLASIAGVGSGEISPVKLYPTILKSEAVLKQVILNKYKTKKFNDSVNLIQYWEIAAKTPELSYEKALLTLRNGLEIEMELKTNIIIITLETEEPQLTADIVNGVTAGLDKFMRTKRATNATKQRQWIESRLGEVRDDLALSENRVKDFRERNRVVLGSPLLMLEQDRLLRDVQINAALFSELKKQFELIKIEEVKNYAIINVLDAAKPAAQKEKPKRRTIVIAWMLAGLFASTGYVYTTHKYGKFIRSFISQLKM